MSEGQAIAKSEFTIPQRVTLPEGLTCEPNVQGVVTGQQDRLGMARSYYVQWASIDLTDATGALIVRKGIITEADLLAAQPKKEDGLTIAVKVDETGLDSALTKARELKSIVRSVAPAKRKPAGKTKPKSKRKR